VRISPAAALAIQAGTAIRIRQSARFFDIIFKTAVNARNLGQQNLTEFNLRGERSWRCARPGQVPKLDLGLPDSTQ